MKKHLHNSLRALLLSLAVLLSLPMMAVEIDGINYDFNAEAKEATVIAKSGDKYSGEVVIPEYVEHDGTAYSVTRIGDKAFSLCFGLTSVTIPNSVMSIGNNAFKRCFGLTSVTIPNSVTSIGQSAFSGCSVLTSVTIGNSVTSIGNNAFYDCWNLTSVHISDIAAWCNIDFDGSGSNPLGYAHHLYLNGEEVKDLVIPNSVTNIGVYAFSGCSVLTSITIPNSVESIGKSAFSNCSGLISVHISDIAAWCNIEFAGSESNPLGYADHLYLNGEEVKDLVIPNSVTSIGDYAFEYCSGLTSLTIPNSVTSIGKYAFSGCSGLPSVTIPNSVTSIGYQAFYYCYFGRANFINNSSLSAEENNYWGAKIFDYETEDGIFIDGTSVVDCRINANIVTIPNSVTSIGASAFEGCSGLTSVTIPNSVTSIGASAFEGCSGLTSVTIPNSVTSIGKYAFSGCSGLTSVTIPNSVTSIGEKTFYDCSGLTSVTIPNSVTSIGASAFEGCFGLTSLTIPNSVKSIGESAFVYCLGLTSVHISDIAAWCNIDFSGYDSNPLSYANRLYLNEEEVKDLVIPNSVTSIRDKAFCGCSDLTSLTIPNSVTSIGRFAFDGCHFVTENFVNNSSLSAEENKYWGAGLHGYETEDGLLIDSTNVAFCRKSANIVAIPNSVTSIGTSAFSGCKGLTSVTIPNSVTSIGNNAFNRCSGLTSVTIPNSVTSIGQSAFYDCSGLTSVTIPNSVTSIGQWAFNRCRGLTSVTIGNSVESIGRWAFSNCPELLDVYCYAEKVPSTEYDAFFDSCPEYATLHVPAASIDSYKATEPWSSFGKIVALTEEETGIDELKGENGKRETPVFDLSGRRVQMAQKGIFIQNGRVVVK